MPETAPRKIKNIKIDPDVAAILRTQLAYDGSEVRITGFRLDPKMYQRVNKILEALGGKWTRRVQAHVFAGPAKDAIADALGDGKVMDRKQSYQFFETPAELARRMVGMAEIKPGMTVLEPSAGRGAIADQVCHHRVTCVELDDANVRVLAAKGYEVSGVDFLAWGIIGDDKMEFDRILMNPPFTAGQDIYHVRHAYDLLSPGGRLVAVMSTSGFNNSDMRSRVFREWLGERSHETEELPAGTFKASGTEIRAMLVTINKD